ncbi:beta-lactamase family protein [Nocardia uniformis]|uniref:Beta-lactamase family protein n=1 Tax=Nocardia uniformis TaxID=53432 RepID=A0A849CG55_9NOCA|nr:serine hydrolase domain-containing protein [Nocardia uniformis]NNH74649.1 beta-lactamase family protein [Nocardia uniformis]
MRRLAAAILILLFTVLMSPTGVASAETGAIDTAAVDRFMSDYLARTRLPGASVAITHGDRVVHVAGYGHDSTGAAVTGDTRMPVASVSKSFAALAVMQLVEAERVELDAPVRQYLPEFRMADSRSERITVRQLLNQTSGMSDRAFPDLRRPQANSLTGAVERLQDARLADDPGTEFHYHNPNFQVAARLVEVIAGQPYADYLRERIFEPIGMNNSVTVDKPRDVPDLPRGYVRLYGIAVPVEEMDWFVGGSHGIVTTAADLAQWLILQNGGGRAANGQRLVSADSVDLMHVRSRVGTYGMGWQHDESDSSRVFHGGDWFTYTAAQELVPESGYGIAVIANTGMALEDDPELIVEGLIDLTRGLEPGVSRPAGIYADWALAAMTLVVALAAGIALARVHRWAVRQEGRPAWLVILRQLPYLTAIPYLVFLPALAGIVFAGRAGGFQHVLYVFPAVLVFLVVATVAGVAVVVTRLVRLSIVRLRAWRGRRTTPETDSAQPLLRATPP